MCSKFHRNAIITGPLDAYCLVCNQCMKTEDDTVTHTEQTEHIDKLKLTPYYDRYKDDCIRKVERGYYCECCNMLFPVLIKVTAHISEPQHVKNKARHVFARTDRGVLAFGRTLISDDAWNGYIDGNCFICNKNIEHEEHASADHVLNLIDSKIEFVDNSPYREAAHGYQCLVCNEKIELGDSTLIAHFDEIAHKNKLTHDATVNSTTSLSMQPVDTITDVVEYNNVTAEATKTFKTNEAKDNGSITVKRTDDTIKTFDTNTNVKQQRSLKEIDDSLSRVNYIQKTSPDNKITCLTCNLQFDEICLNNHLNDQHHKALLLMHKNRIEQLSSDSESAIGSNNVVDTVNEIVVSLTELHNNGIRIDFERNLAICKMCSKTLTFKFSEIEAHVKKHKELPKEVERGDFLNDVIEIDDMKNIVNAHKKVAKQLVSEGNEDITKDNNKNADNNKEIELLSELNKEVKQINVDIAENNKPTVDNFVELITQVHEEVKRNAKNVEEIAELVGNKNNNKSINKKISDNNNNNNKEIVGNNVDIVETKQEITVKRTEIIEQNEDTNEIKKTDEFDQKINKIIKNETELAHRQEIQRGNDSTNENCDKEKMDLNKNIELHSFLDTVTVVQDVMTGFQFIPIRDKIAISFDSFFMVVLINFKYYRCYLCEMAFSAAEKQIHLDTPKHSTGMVNIAVKTSLESEFVREIRPGEHHCGVCNILYPGWDSMKAHLNTTRHKETKQNLMWFLEEYKTNL